MAIAVPPAPTGADVLARAITGSRAPHLALALVDLDEAAGGDLVAAHPAVTAGLVGPATVGWLMADTALAPGPTAGVRTTVVRVRTAGAPAPEAALDIAWTPCGCPAGHPPWSEPAACPARRLRLARLVHAAGLSDDEADALVLRLGLDGGPALAMAAVAAEAGLTAHEAAALLAGAIARVAGAPPA